MLSAVGIIAEYNPFHNGHLYQLRTAKRKTGADVSVVVMSGNWVQRGQPAIIDKWDRTQSALDNGADLIIELPSYFAVQPANIFAKGGMQLINALHCKWLAFGCEHPDINFNILASKQFDVHSTEFKQFNHSYSYLYRKFILKKTGINLNNPNDILAFNYAKANLNCNFQSDLVPIKRLKSNHNENNINGKLNSSSAIRNNLLNNKSYNQVLNTIPDNTNSFLDHHLLSWKDFWPWLRYELIETSINQLHQIYQMNEGIEYRLKRAAISSITFNEFITKVKTKRYTYSRLYRLCFYVLMHFKRSIFKSLDNISYIRILGFNSNGRHYLRQIKNDINLPIISKTDKKMLKLFLNNEFKVGMLTSILLNNNQDLYRHPIIR